MEKLVTNGYELPKTVGIVYSDVKREYFPTEEQYITEKDALSEAELTATYIEKLGVKVNLYAGDADLTKNLRKKRPEVVINFVGSVKGNEFLAASIPGALELLEIPYTGAGILGESLSYNKFLIKKLLEQNGIPVPHYQLINSPNDYLYQSLRYPLISKLNEIHGAVELNRDCVSENEKHLRERLKFLISTYRQAVLVEEFIVGDEINAVLLEGLNKKVYLASTIINEDMGRYQFKSFEIQWISEKPDVIEYSKFKDPILNEYVKKAFSICDMSDYGRFDVRIDSSGRYFFLDANSNPHLAPKETGCPFTNILDVYGITFLETMKRILINTVRDAKGKEKLPYAQNGD